MTDECALSPEAKTLQWNEKNLGNIFMITLNGSEGADALVKKRYAFAATLFWLWHHSVKKAK